MVDLFNLNRSVYSEMVKATSTRLDEFREQIPGIHGDDWKERISNAYREIFGENLGIIEDQKGSTYPEQQTILEEMLAMFKEDCRKIISQSPETIVKQLSLADLAVHKGDKAGTIYYKLRKRLFGGVRGGYRHQKVRFRKLVASHFSTKVFAELTEVMQNWGMISIQQIIKTQNFDNRVFDTYFLLNKLKPDISTANTLRLKKDDLAATREQFDKLNEASLQTLYTLLMNKTLYLVRNISREVQEAHTSSYIRTNEKKDRELEKTSSQLGKSPKKWKENQVFLDNFSISSRSTGLISLGSNDPVRRSFNES